ncbi:hypothetical protein BH09ACT12_BH09ACT12_07670 [soil metagenome]
MRFVRPKAAPLSQLRTGDFPPSTVRPIGLPSAVPSADAVSAGTGSVRAPWVLVGAVLLMTGLLAIFARKEFGATPTFLPAFLAIVLVGTALTAVLLMEQYRAGGSPRLLVLSWAFLWVAATVVPYAMVFTGLFTSAGLLGSVPSASPWLWVSWHVGFVLFIGTGLMPWPGSWHRVLGRAGDRGRRSIVSVALVLAGAWGFAALVTAGAEVMPVIISDGDYSMLTERFGPWIAVILIVAASAGCVGVVRRRCSGVELWAFTALSASLGDAAVTLLARDRFTFGWYGARLLALVAALTLLVTMLHEITALHRRVLRSADLLAQQNLRLLETQALRDHLVAVVSHDLRTPVAGMTGYLELLGDGGLTPQQSDRMIRNSQRLARQLTLMIEDLLAVATAQEGTLDIRPELIDVRRALEEAWAGFPDLDVRIECALGLVAWVDPLRLQQVLANLLGNAAKYGAEPIRLSAVLGDGPAESPGVRFEVIDSGEGVPEAFVEHLFDRYSRAEGVAAQGSGLGLSVVRDLVAAHDGSVYYDPQRKAFVVALPDRRLRPAHVAPGEQDVELDAS